ncbi:MAG: diaminopimelate epimerase [Clostridia bacterium]|nr:diaminopimelate epimerase [Clostridia bacterium]
MRFFKMHNLCNDYIYTFSKNITPKKIKRLCNRNSGIGADGVIIISKPNDYYALEVFNSDASRATFCGSACLSAGFYLYKKGLVGKKFTLLTGAGKRKMSVISNNAIKIYCPYGNFNIDKSVSDCGKIINRLLTFNYCGEQIKVRCSGVWVGNFHLVIFADYSFDQMQKITLAINSDNRFKNGVNIVFACITGDKIKLTVCERGSGFTKACISGGFACLSVLKKLGFKGKKVRLCYAGGIAHGMLLEKRLAIVCEPKMVFEGNCK